MPLISSRLITPPTTPIMLPLALQTQIRHIGDITDEEATAFIAVAEAYLDGPNGRLRRALVSQVWEWKFEGAHPREWLPLAPMIEVEAFDGVQGVEVIRDTWLRFDCPSDLVTITARVGYGAASDVPAPIQHAALLIAAQQDRQREALSEISEAFKGAREAKYSVSDHVAAYVRHSF